ncbi:MULTISPECIES: HlyD family secretion protein [unclassified Variovorax]|uniref:HlyD family secretion protein n=1 Tax=unclassified Variovorax TaxID=663243 RepID=UPI00076CCAE4|nr:MULTISPECIES: HlyD family secretion protein [unclassified Variovorax]KWT94130.1 Membrane fusion component of tripartite multidrug resistance system [Variovorax sp. WDL1]PNG59911.1 putative multidrug resistance protein EmrK [Variovorax sp. B4]PNG60298.1 putative multidrug resistance protein EmrK [Variovorax sp. B2]VTV13855.1 Multidrug resistance protein MdtN [Variovorax sp. WDL1]
MTKNRRFRITAVAIAASAIVGAFLILNQPESGAAEQSTDDAYVRADFTVVAPQVAGVVSQVAVDDHQQVQAGEPLVHIDDRALRIAVDAAKATVDSLQAQLARQQSAITQARAAVAAARANLKLAQANRHRFANLARDGSGTVQAQEQAEAQWDVQRATREREQAGLRAAEQQVAILRAELEKAEAAKANAELNLSYASVVAPVSGVIAQRKARVGGYARIGDPLLTLVPLDALYVEANLRETQSARVRVGQPVDITVDALPGVRLKGRVESLGPASGVSFSPVPPHNATGNFTKIVQRLPVRIHLVAGQGDAHRLRVGMSVRPRIDVGVEAVAFPES